MTLIVFVLFVVWVIIVIVDNCLLLLAIHFFLPSIHEISVIVGKLLVLFQTWRLAQLLFLVTLLLIAVLSFIFLIGL